MAKDLIGVHRGMEEEDLGPEVPFFSQRRKLLQKGGLLHEL